MEENGRGRKHQDTIFGTRRTDGQGVDPLLARMAQANAIRQAHGFRVSVDKGERQSTDLLIGILLRPLAPCGKSRPTCAATTVCPSLLRTPCST
jgi:hypothetical protein